LIFHAQARLQAVKAALQVLCKRGVSQFFHRSGFGPIGDHMAEL